MKDEMTKICFDSDSGAGTGGSEGPGKSGLNKENPPTEPSLGFSPDQGGGSGGTGGGSKSGLGQSASGKASENEASENEESKKK